MIDDINIYRTVNVLVELHGENAPIQAAMKADALLKAGDVDGQPVWKRSPSCFQGAFGASRGIIEPQ